MTKLTNVRALLGLLFLASLLTLTPNPAQAATAPTGSLQVDITLQNNGITKVVESFDYLSPVPFSWVIRAKTQTVELKNPDQTITPKIDKVGETTQVSSDSVSDRWILTYTSANSLVRHDDRDQIFVKIFQNTGKYLENIQVNFTLESKLKPDNFSANLYAIGGTSEVVQNTVNNPLASYSLDTAGPSSIVTFSSSWDKDFLPVDITEQIKLDLMNLDLLPWLIIGLLLPLLGLGALTHLFIKRRSLMKRVTSVIDQAPENISPMFVGVLVNKKIFEHEIVATIVNLCERGYLVIVKKNAEFLLSQKKPLDDGLANWEKLFLGQIFSANNGKINEENLTDLSKESLYSPTIHQAFEEVYETVNNLGYFKENPHLTRMRYKLLAIALYFVSLGAALWIVIEDLNAALLIPLVGTMILAWLIIRLTPQLSSYTKVGNEKRIAWQSFTNYLSSNEPFDVKSSVDATFERYLSYAIVLGVTESWAKRFENASRSTLKPDWFISYQDQTQVQFVKDITGFTESISKVISKLRGPLVN